MSANDGRHSTRSSLTKAPAQSANQERSAWKEARLLVPGSVLSGLVAAGGVLAAPYVEFVVANPAMVIALVLGIALNSLAQRPIFQPGITFCVKRVLRWSVALLGLRIAFVDIVSLGVDTALLVVGAMIVTLGACFLLAGIFGQHKAYGALTGAATAVCGASAALATSSVLPKYETKDRDVAFVVVMANALATLAMLLYPILCAWMDLGPEAMGILLGGSIHDVAQVVGAGYAVSETVGNTAVIVKLFRVFLLLPIVLTIAWWFNQRSAVGAEVQPAPAFAIVFLALCVLNSTIGWIPGLVPAYESIRLVLIDVSTWGLLLAIAALGLGTSVSQILAVRWHHVGTMVIASTVIFAVTAGGLFIIGS